ncbi:type-1 angiotensin II receptor-associated protein-like isoform X3 [Penaeus japonicus]|uniref:type-1 angiotensin II receptor-associated protein-like isoform X3 n=1 Tax=Penaeus japonicus TaxID=27405 RepID=UPI001C70DB5C|nr:type-1 angiotensin II receptor-associated protein-like isoform X3 [Penaeus japonicus]
MEITLPNASITLKGIFFTHLILTVWSGMCGCLTDSFVLYNTILLITIMWSLHHRESDEAPFMAFCVNVLSIMFDIVNMSLNWPAVQTGGSMTFGAAMAIINLLVRPLSSYLLYRIFQDRAGSYGTFGLPSGFDSIFAGGRRSPYEDIDQPPQQTPSGIDTQNAAAPGSPPENLFTT